MATEEAMIGAGGSEKVGFANEVEFKFLRH